MNNKPKHRGSYNVHAFRADRKAFTGQGPDRGTRRAHVSVIVPAGFGLDDVDVELAEVEAELAHRTQVSA